MSKKKNEKGARATRLKGVGSKGEILNGVMEHGAP